MPWSFDFVSFWKLLETILGWSVASSMGDPARKKCSFWDPQGCWRATLFPRVSGDQFGSHLDVFGRAPNNLLLPFLESFSVRSSVHTRYTYQTCISHLHIARACRISTSDMRIEYANPIRISYMHNCVRFRLLFQLKSKRIKRARSARA